MAQNSHFIIGKNKFGYRKKQQRLTVLLWNLWNHKKDKKNNSNEKEMHFC